MPVASEPQSINMLHGYMISELRAVNLVPGLEPNAPNAGKKRLAAGGCLQACTEKDRVSFPGQYKAPWKLCLWGCGGGQNLSWEAQTRLFLNLPADLG